VSSTEGNNNGVKSRILFFYSDADDLLVGMRQGGARVLSLMGDLPHALVHLYQIRGEITMQTRVGYKVRLSPRGG
jgi:hypothetical protein